MITGIPPTKFFETFLELSRQKGLSASIAVEEAGLHRSAVTNWRRGKLPGEKALSKLTAYFGVTRQYLLEGAPTEAGSNDVDKTAPSVDIERVRTLNQLRSIWIFKKILRYSLYQQNVPLSIWPFIS